MPPSDDASCPATEMNWFEKLTGFREDGYESTRRRLEVEGETLRSKVNGRAWGIGRLETPTLAELRARADLLAPRLPGPLRVSCICGDVRPMHQDSSNAGALFQVASQFNLLEMAGPSVTPEDGVTRYAHDRTQGPACAIAAGAATIYRNYFAPVGGEPGQTHDRQVDCLADVGDALGNRDCSLWTMRNGYAMCSERGLSRIASTLSGYGDTQHDALRDRLRIGVQWNVEATEAAEPRPRLSQAFCSALPVAYAGGPTRHWQAFATLVLEGAYEATLWAAVVNAGMSGSRKVFLTSVGGGAFGNDDGWIFDAQRRALDLVAGTGLDVRLVCYRAPSRHQIALVERYRAAK